MSTVPCRSAAARSGGSRPVLAARRALRAVSLVVCGAAIVAAGCGQSSVSPAASSGPAAHASQTTPSSARPSASPKVDPGQAAMTAFVALVTKDGFSYQGTFSGDDRHTTDIFPIRNGLLQVSGDDVLVRATFTLQAHSDVVEHRYVGGKAWIRYGTTDTWHRLTFIPADSMGAFAAVRTTSDVTYLGPVAAGGSTLFKVAFRSAIVNPVMIPASNLTETVLTSPKLTLLIDAAGRPVKGTAEIDGHGRVSGQLQEIVIDLAVTFTKLGQAVTITAP